MSLRNKSYRDYGISRKEIKEILRMCRDTNFSKKDELMICAKNSNEQIAEYIYKSIITSDSYDKMCNHIIIPINKNDFYAYRRKTIALFIELIKNDRNRSV